VGYLNLRECLNDLERTGQLVRIEREVDPHLEAAAIHRRVYKAGGPAVFYARVAGTPFPMVSNLYGTPKRLRFLFRDTIQAIEQLIELKTDPAALRRSPLRYAGVPRAVWHTRPKWVNHGPILQRRLETVAILPQLWCWPGDGGAFATLTAVYTEDAACPGLARSNLGMYRVQLSGGQYQPGREVGLHYQIHRGIGVHHASARERGVPFRVNVIIGGPPALPLAAVFPLPEGMPEMHLAGALGGRRLHLVRPAGELPIPAEADFCITGTVDADRLLPEGPFGDHLGYYSLAHPFPVLRVEHVYHRPDAIWPFTVVGRPPQEDTSFGQFIHELTGPIIPTTIAGVHAVHAVDAAGVHPLLLAQGSERYTPFLDRATPQEILTNANAILGQGQLSLAKYLLIAAREDDPGLDVHDIEAFFRHVLERVDWRTGLHFQTCTTMDTLDYSGGALNAGSKVIIAAVGRKRRDLSVAVPEGLSLPEGFGSPRVCLPGILAIQGPPWQEGNAACFAAQLTAEHSLNRFPLVVLVDDSAFTAASLGNFLWVAFTRSNPAADIEGIGAFVEKKHWGCTGALVIDARLKPHHAPPLEEDPSVERHIDALGAPGGPLHGII
jgi:4-hydroxy-3-polyprenylbenzoate decarboxylase